MIEFNFLRKQNSVDCENYLKDWLKVSKLDQQKVEILTALIFLNIAALLHYPYSLLLFYLGKTMLHRLSKEMISGKVLSVAQTLEQKSDQEAHLNMHGYSEEHQHYSQSCEKQEN
ncbi:MAG: hypothetical protein IT292_09970 [Deltaproteobacteria bacterium]|nr:hypothetical protein [Deltaproteobacteria bacterium]